MFDEKQNQKDICRALAWQHGDKDAAEALLMQYQPLIRSIRQNSAKAFPTKTSSRSSSFIF